MGPTGDVRVVQIHPTLRCNLRCLHCYSSSGPDVRGSLPLGLLAEALGVLRGEGYNVASLSGGEPLLYRPLPELLGTARALGMATTVTTNGMLLTEARIDALREQVDLIAISLDGVPASHNRVRGAHNAFEKMASRLEGLRQAEIPFGFIFTLTLYNLDELAAVAAFAAEQGAVLLQVHPLEEVGRARSELPRTAPDDRELSFAFLEVARLQARYAGRMTIQYDVVTRDAAREEPERLFAGRPAPNAEALPLAALVAPLIVEHDGTVVPLQYGFDPRLAVARLGERELPDQIDRWKRDSYPDFVRLCQGVRDGMLVATRRTEPFTNWYSRVIEASREQEVALGA